MSADNKQSIISFIENHIVCEMGSWALGAFIDRLPEDGEEAAARFCDWFELGDWFYEAMVINEINITEVLIELAESRRQAEEKGAEESAEVERDLKRMQGWPV